jgi:hypothetical protein
MKMNFLAAVIAFSFVSNVQASDLPLELINFQQSLDLAESFAEKNETNIESQKAGFCYEDLASIKFHGRQVFKRLLDYTDISKTSDIQIARERNSFFYGYAAFDSFCSGKQIDGKVASLEDVKNSISMHIENAVKVRKLIIQR